MSRPNKNARQEWDGQNFYQRHFYEASLLGDIYANNNEANNLMRHTT